MTLTARDAACDKRRPTGPTTDNAPAHIESTHSVADGSDIPHGEWWRHPATAYTQGLRDGRASGFAAGYRAAGRAFGTAIAEAAAPLSWTAGEVVRRLVGDLSRQAAHAEAPAGACGAGAVRPVGLDAWPGEDALSPSQRAAAVRRRLASWDRP